MEETTNVLFRLPGKRLNSYIYHINDGFYYHFHPSNTTSLYFRCVHSVRRGRGCSGKAVLSLGQHFTVYENHNHSANMSYAEYLACRNYIVGQARSLMYVSFWDIMQLERTRVMRQHFPQLNLRRLQPAMNRAALNALPAEPFSLRELSNVLNDPCYQSLVYATNFSDCIYRGSADANDGSHVILLGTRRCIDFLKMITVVYGISTPFTSDRSQQQFVVHTIATVWNSQVLPLAWCVLEGHSREAYVASFLLLRSQLVQWNFRHVICDVSHEQISEAYKVVFAVKTSSSVHHFIKTLAEASNVAIPFQQLKDDRDAVSMILLCCAIPLLPQDLILEGLREIDLHCSQLNNTFLLGHIRLLLRHIHSQYITNPQVSVFGCPDRTNDVFGKIQQIMQRKTHSATIYSLLGFLKQIEEQSHKATLPLAGVKHSRRVYTLSNDSELKVLSRALWRPPLSLSSAVYDLLNVASRKLQHLNFIALLN